MCHENEFEPIYNPYTRHAVGPVVDNPAMFYGRVDFIQCIASTIQESRDERKQVLLLGQWRSGRSSILYHIKKTLETDERLLVLDLGNIGSLCDMDIRVPLRDQILFEILRGLEKEVILRGDAISNSLEFSFPHSRELFRHPNPLQFFKDTFENVKRAATEQANWRGVQILLLVDNFEIICSLFVNGRLPSTFLQNWKTFTGRLSWTQATLALW